MSLDPINAPQTMTTICGPWEITECQNLRKAKKILASCKASGRYSESHLEAIAGEGDGRDIYTWRVVSRIKATA
jgi:hypothetical protein